MPCFCLRGAASTVPLTGSRSPKVDWSFWTLLVLKLALFSLGWEARLSGWVGWGVVLPSGLDPSHRPRRGGFPCEGPPGGPFWRDEGG